MLIHILVKQTQSELGYIDEDIIAAYTDEKLAKAAKTTHEDADVEKGELVAGREESWPADDQDADSPWTTSYFIKETTLHRAPQTSTESQHYIDTGESPASEALAYINHDID